MNGTIKDNCLYTRDGETLLYSAGDEKILIIPDGVKKIGECAFAHLGAHEWVVTPKEMEHLQDFPWPHPERKLKIFYKGSKKEGKKLIRSRSCFISPLAILYLYSENFSAFGNNWHFRKDGVTPEFHTNFFTKFMKTVRVSRTSIMAYNGYTFMGRMDSFMDDFFQYYS